MKTRIELAYKLNYIDSVKFEKIEKLCDDTSKMLYGLIDYIEKECSL
ncbi:MAG: four helix bundle protein [Elusimicrobia bacterium]|nr:four helix bundle protein [Candidatus Liberimonas magnetica]